MKMPQYFPYGAEETAHLAACDDGMRAAIERFGHIQREVTPDLFAALTDSIVSQQISGVAAATVLRRLCDRTPLTPEALDEMAVEDIKSCGMSLRKAGYIKGAAEAVRLGTLDLASFAEQEDAQIISALVALPGIGVWTAEMLLIFSLMRPDVMSFGDLGIRRGLIRMHGLSELSRAQFEIYRARYSPHGSVASFYCWAMAALPQD